MDNSFCFQYVRLLLRMRLPHIVRLIYIVRLPYLVRLFHIVRLPIIVRLLYLVRLVLIMKLSDICSCWSAWYKLKLRPGTKGEH